jgi:hypothetical protein
VLAAGADTTVVVDGQVLGKPGHPEEAKAMLRKLSGKTHEVLTAVALARTSDTLETWSEVSSSLVRFLIITEEEIDDYVKGGEPMDKAGAYALNGEAAIFIESVQGSPSGVIGLPFTLWRGSFGGPVSTFSPFDEGVCFDPHPSLGRLWDRRSDNHHGVPAHFVAALDNQFQHHSHQCWHDDNHPFPRSRGSGGGQSVGCHGLVGWRLLGSG